MKIDPNRLVGLIERLRPFWDAEGRCFVMLVDDESNEDFVIHLPVDSTGFTQRLRMMLVREGFEGLPGGRDVGTVVEMIKGHAYSQPQQEATLLPNKVVAKQPLVRAIFKLLQDGPVDLNPCELLRRLDKVAEDCGISRGMNWPTSEDALGRQLSKLRPTLARLGVVAKPSRSDKRKWALHLQENAYEPIDDTGSGEGENEASDASHETPAAYDEPVTSPQIQDCVVSLSDEVLFSQLGENHV